MTDRKDAHPVATKPTNLMKCRHRQRLAFSSYVAFCFVALPLAIAKVADAQSYNTNTPAMIRTAYGFNRLGSYTASGTKGTTGEGQTIAIVDAYNGEGDTSATTIDDGTTYNQTNLTQDVSTFDTRFGLPAINLTVVGQTGTTASVPSTYVRGWALEETLDVEYAHAIAPGATIKLYEANTNGGSDLIATEIEAASQGASVVSMSFGGTEGSSEANVSRFNVAQVAFIAASGDDGSSTGVSSPAGSPYVIGVGATNLKDSSKGVYSSEESWKDSGGGISTYTPEPSYQTNSIGKLSGRGVPDVSYNGGELSPVATTFGQADYENYGTSAGTPQWAALICLADQLRAADGLPALSSTEVLTRMYALVGTPQYSLAFRDITANEATNGNGSYSAGTGYDEVTGLGTPIANYLVPYLADVPEPASFASVILIAPLLLRRSRRKLPI